MYEKAAIIAFTGYFLLAAGHYLIGQLTTDLPEYRPETDDQQPITDNRWRAQFAENILRKVRRTKRRYGWKTRKNEWKSEIESVWQYKAMTLAPDAFELFLVNEVWGYYGLEKERWKISYLRTKNGLAIIQHCEKGALEYA